MACSPDPCSMRYRAGPTDPSRLRIVEPAMRASIGFRYRRLGLPAAARASRSAFHEPEWGWAGFAPADVDAHDLGRLGLQALHERYRGLESRLIAVEGVVEHREQFAVGPLECIEHAHDARRLRRLGPRLQCPDAPHVFPVHGEGIARRFANIVAAFVEATLFDLFEAVEVGDFFRLVK